MLFTELWACTSELPILASTEKHRDQAQDNVTLSAGRIVENTKGSE